MEEKMEEVEAGYDTLIEMQPDDERKYLEKKAGISDEAVQPVSYTHLTLPTICSV